MDDDAIVLFDMVICISMFLHKYNDDNSGGDDGDDDLSVI